MKRERGDKQNRRQFLESVAGAMVVGKIDYNAILNAVEFHGAVKFAYPRNVYVGRKGRLTLYALGKDLTVESVFTSPFENILSTMISRLQQPSTAGLSEPMDFGANQKAGALNALQQLKTAVLNAGRPLTLEFLCTRPAAQWGATKAQADAVHDKAAVADYYFSVPFLRVNKGWAANFLAPGKHMGQSFYERTAGKTIADLFLKPKDSFDGLGRYLIPQARVAGLLWCYPKGHPDALLAFHGPLPDFNTPMSGLRARRIGSNGGTGGGGGDGIPSEGDPRAGLTCNGDGTACIEGNPDDYCQMVDGACNAMSS